MIFSIIVRASDCYWKILAERARLKLDDQLRENRQVGSREKKLFLGKRLARSFVRPLATSITR